MRWWIVGLALLSILGRAASGDIAYQFADVTPAGYDGARAFAGSGGQIVGEAVPHGSTTPYYPVPVLLQGGTAVNLLPAGFDWGQAHAVDQGTQVGEAFVQAPPGRINAFLWHGSAASAVNLQPAGYGPSDALAVRGNEQVGTASTQVPGGYGQHAALWHGTADTFVDLNPDGFLTSVGNGTDAVHEIGTGLLGFNGPEHALLWSGSPGSAVDLNPAGATDSWGSAVDGPDQVGFVGTLIRHAALWHGSAASFVDLHPGASYSSSEAFAVRNGVIAGDATALDGHFHAMAWINSDPVDLQQVIPSQAGVVESWALGVDEAGDVFGYAQTAGQAGSDYYRAVEWRAVPEPASGLLLAIAVFGWRASIVRGEQKLDH